MPGAVAPVVASQFVAPARYATDVVNVVVPDTAITLTFLPMGGAVCPVTAPRCTGDSVRPRFGATL